MAQPFSPFAALDICEESDVTEALDEARAVYPRLDALLIGVTWRLARRPEGGTRIETGERTYYVLKTADKGLQFPVLVFLYTVDDSRVTLESVRVLPPQGAAC